MTTERFFLSCDERMERVNDRISLVPSESMERSARILLIWLAAVLGVLSLALAGVLASKADCCLPSVLG